MRKRAFASLCARIPSVKMALDVDRALLYERIDGRVEKMVEAGLVEEVSGLLEAGFSRRPHGPAGHRLQGNRLLSRWRHITWTRPSPR